MCVWKCIKYISLERVELFDEYELKIVIEKLKCGKVIVVE